MSGAALRRVLHLASAGILVFLPLVSLHALRVAAVGLAVAGLAVELARLHRPTLRARLERLVPVYRPAEATRFSGAAWLALGYALAVWFPPSAAVAGVLTAAVADPAASFIGQRVGPVGRKTWAGTVVVFGVASGILTVVGAPWWVAVTIGVVAAGIERWPGPLDDNLLLPPVVAFGVFLLA